MDANIYEMSDRRGRGKTSLSAFTDEIEGELEKISIVGVHMTRRVVLSILGLVAGVGSILGIAISAGSSKNNMDKALFEQDHKFWSMGTLIESTVGKEIYQEGTSKYKALVWLADKDPKHLHSSSPIEEVLQRFVLADLYFSTTGDQWNNKYKFLTRKNVCDWNDKTSGVFCNENGQITTLLMPENDLYGTIPQDIGLLSNMERFNLTRNRLEGTIPNSIGIMSSMTNFDLSMNEISGSIPKSIAMLLDLVHLDFSYNSLEGRDDIDLMKELPSLEELRLNNNLLEGKVGQFGGSDSLRIIDLSYNHIQGTLATKIPDGKSLEILRLNNNKIESTIPGSFGKLSNLLLLDISNNEITGSLPTNVGTMESLEVLQLNNNEIAYELPSELGNLENLKMLEVSSNNVDAIPSELFSMKSLEDLALSDNYLKGSLPSEIGLATSLVYLDLANNELTSKLPPEVSNLSNLEYLYLNNNNFNGEIPSEIGGLDKLRDLDITNTDFFGSMSSQFCESGSPIENFSADCLLTEIDLPCATECCDGQDGCCFTGDPECKPKADQYDV